MRAVLPGKPQARLQAVCTGYWDGKEVIVSSEAAYQFLYRSNNQLQAYITGNAIVILRSYDTILQTIYDEDAGPLNAIAFDEAYGKIASCAGPVVRIYKPYGQDEDSLKVRLVWKRYMCVCVCV